MSDDAFVDFSKPPLKPGMSQRAFGTMDKILQAPESTPFMRSLRLVHRLAVFAVALLYVGISLQSFSTAVIILRGAVSHNLPLQTHTTSLIVSYAGSTTIQESPLVQHVLGGSTTPREDTLYLESSTSQSSSGCSNVSNYDAKIYSNVFLRFLFSKLQEHASYNLSYVSGLELVAPVVDCTFDLLVSGDPTVARVYYLARPKSDSTNALLLSTSLSAQDYQVAQQFQKGPGLVVLVTPINDMRATSLDHQIAVALNYPYVAKPAFAYSELAGTDGDNNWILQMLPNQRNHDPAKLVRMARRFGRYMGDPTAQSNIETAHLELQSDPKTELGGWTWHGRAVLHDSWAWTHAAHGIFALNVIFNLTVLSFVMYRRLRMGHFWVGDAFSTISSMLLYRGLLVVVFNFLNGFWTVTKMCISIGDTITGRHAIYYRPELVHADLLSVFLNVVSLLSYLARERIDPLLAFATFELGWSYRVELAKLFPSLRKHIENFAVADATMGLLDVSPGLAALSPMELLTAYGVVANRRPVVLSVVVSICSPLVLIVVYLACRKAARYVTSPASGGKGATRRRPDAYAKGLEETVIETKHLTKDKSLVPPVRLVLKEIDTPRLRRISALHRAIMLYLIPSQTTYM
ncbi:hypothetical protein PHYPSEUDO_004643 [Phytophthora pseudosyringae]|uniref:Transmembrane protein n=1 Tax=Phytophthora pseudosyringae TaxID=221518 RepID=A0A8T1VRK9_9STRA|nr:hypothetical protein PHYPSEUDO_004643 [Phytophthora pseudosyringae]